jgi:hypothetical protein
MLATVFSYVQRHHLGLLALLGPAGATNVTVRSGTQGTGQATAACDTGEVAVGGGGLSFDPQLAFLRSSNPTPVGSPTPTGWEVFAARLDGTGAIATEAVVICAAP